LNKITAVPCLACGRDFNLKVVVEVVRIVNRFQASLASYISTVFTGVLDVVTPIPGESISGSGQAVKFSLVSHQSRNRRLPDAVNFAIPVSR
jgi:hypothetical protein